MKRHYIFLISFLSLFFLSQKTDAQELRLDGFFLERLQIHYNDTNYSESPFIERFTAVGDYDNGVVLANTGLSYDPIKHVLYHSRNNKGTSSKIYIKDKDNTFLGEIDITQHLGFIQGLAYLSKDETFYIWGARKGYTPPSDDSIEEDPDNLGYTFFEIIHVDKNGNLLDKFSTPLYNDSPGMLTYDPISDGIWAKGNGSTFAFLYNRHTGEVKRRIKFFRMNQEGFDIAVAFDSSFWVVNEYDKALLVNHRYNNINPNAPLQETLGYYPNCKTLNQSEGLVVDPSDYTIWKNADAFRHKPNIPGYNSVYHFDPKRTYNKDVFFPNMMAWEKGKTLENLEIVGNRLCLQEGKNKGTWMSPVIDFGGYSPQIPKVLIGNSNIKIKYRGTNIPPQTNACTKFPCHFFDAKQNNEGWGSINPCEWSEELPDYRYMQYIIEINPAICVNEFMANYGDKIKDENGEADDWIEIYNNSPAIVKIKDLKLTLIEKNGTKKTHYLTNNKTILKQGAALRLWADKTPGQGENHLTFSLKNSDFVQPYIFSSIIHNASFGFYPDAIGEKRYMIPTPNKKNTNRNLTPYLTTKISDIEGNEDEQGQIIIPTTENFFTELTPRDHIKFSTQMLTIGLDSIVFDYQNDTAMKIYPIKDFTGDIFVRVIVTDDSLALACDTIKITINSINDLPTIVSNFYTLKEDSHLDLPNPGILDNDFDPDLYDELSSIKVQNAKNGTCLINSEGGLQYTPNKDFYGKDSITYKVFDGNEYSEEAKVYFTVSPINDAPFFEFNEQLSFNEDNTQTYDLSIWAKDIDSPFTDLSLKCNSSEHIKIEQNNWEITFSSLQENWNGDEEIIFEITDGTDTGFVSHIVKCLPVNDSPKINIVDNFNFDEDLLANYDLSLYINDLDNTIEQQTIRWEGNYSINIEKIGNEIKLSSNQKDWFGSEEITFYTSDGEYEVSQTVTIICNPINDSMEVNIPPVLDFEEDKTKNYNFSEYVFDVDNPQSELTLTWKNNININIELSPEWDLTFSSNIENWNGSEIITFSVFDGKNTVSKQAEVFCRPQNDAPELNITGTFSYIEGQNSEIYNLFAFASDCDNNMSELTLNYIENENITAQINGWNIIFSSKNPDWFGTQAVTFTVTDGDKTTQQTIDVTCTPTNDKPIINFYDPLSFIEDENKTYDFTQFISDVDNQYQELNIRWEGNTNIEVRKNGWEITFSSLTENWNGEENITFYVNDGEFEVEKQVLITCLASNDKPVIYLTENIEFNEDENITKDFANYISDVDNSINEISISWKENPNISIIANDKNLVFASKNENWNGKEDINFTFSDGENIVNKTITINCKPVNDAPNLNFPNSPFFNEDEQLTYNFDEFCNDIDNQFSDLILTWENNSNINISRQENKLILTSNLKDWNGKKLVKFTLSDGEFNKTQEVEIYCKAVNDTPNINITEPLTFNEDETKDFDFNTFISDVDNQNEDLHLTWKGNNNIHITNTNNILTFSAEIDWYGAEEITFQLSDGLTIEEKTATITVLSINDKPQVSIPSELSYIEDESNIYDFSNFITDTDNALETLNTTWSGDENILIEQEGWNFKFSSKYENWNGEAEIIFTISDEEFEIKDTTIVKVISQNDPPQINLTDIIEINEDESLNLDLSQKITDIDNIHSSLNLSYSETENFVIEQTNWSFTFSPKIENWNGEENITFTVSDSEFTINKTVLLKTKPINDICEINLPENIEIQEDITKEIDLNLYISDIETPIENLILTWENNQNTIIKRENNILKITGNENWSGQDEIHFSLYDGITTVQKTVIINCTPINDAPIFLKENIVFLENETFSLDIINFVLDTDNQLEELTISWEENKNILITREENILKFSIKHIDWNGIESIKFTAADGDKTTIHNLTARVTGTNNPPEFDITQDFEFEEDSQSQIYDFSLFVSDVDNTNEELNISWTSNNNIKVVKNGLNISFENNTPNWNGEEQIIFLLDDGMYQKSSTATVRCNPVNDAPNLDFPTQLSYFEGESNTYSFLEYISDIDSDIENLTISWEGNSQIKVAKNSWLFTFSSENEYWNGEENISFTVSDGEKETTKILKVVCNPINNLPTFALPQIITFNEDENTTINFSEFITDPEENLNNLTLSWNENENIKIEKTAWKVKFSSKKENWFGNELVTFQLNDNGQANVIKQVLIKVENINDAPIIIAQNPQTEIVKVQTDEEFTFEIEAQDNDSPVLNYTWFIDNQQQAINNNKFNYTFDKVQSFNIKAVVSDGEFEVEKNWTAKANNYAPIVDVENHEFYLLQNRPNPFKEKTTIEFYLTKNQKISLKIYDESGKLIKTLIANKFYKNGKHEIVWNGTNLNSGIYYYQLETKNSKTSKKAIRID